MALQALSEGDQGARALDVSANKNCPETRCKVNDADCSTQTEMALQALSEGDQGARALDVSANKNCIETRGVVGIADVNAFLDRMQEMRRMPNLQDNSAPLFVFNMNPQFEVAKAGYVAFGNMTVGEKTRENESDESEEQEEEEDDNSDGCDVEYEENR